MKKFNKTLIAAAMVLGAGSANANVVNNSGGLNDLFLVVYDSTATNADGSQGRTYTLDTNITFDSLVTNAASALSAFTSGLNLAADSLWTQFVGTGLDANARFGLFVGSAGVGGNTVGGLDVFTTGNALGPNPSLSNANLSSDGNAMDAQAGRINLGLNAPTGTAGLSASANSLLIQDNSSFTNSGQAGGNFSSTWGGWAIGDPTSALGAANPVDFQFGGHTAVTVVNRGVTSIQQQFLGNSTDLIKLGKFTLAGNSLTFAPSAVPLPAAVWMFGAGLMGLLRANRRKSIAA